jgi:hypothetical protein
MHGLINMLEQEWNQEESESVKEKLASLGAFALIGFCGSFRGSEVFLTDLFGLKKFLEEADKYGQDHLVIPLLGQFKGEQNSRYHLSPMAKVTSSGLPIQRWVRRLVQVREREKRTNCPASCDKVGGKARSFEYEAGFIERLLELQASNPDAIPPDVDITEQFGISRSFRRGPT